jgi:hypothetical protein
MKTSFMVTITLITLLTMTTKKLMGQDLFQDDALAVEHPIPGDGIWVEKPNNDTISHKYAFNNTTYKLYRTFIYEYSYKDKQGKLHKFLPADSAASASNSLNLTSETKSTEGIDYVMLVITDDRNTYKECDSSCTQTAMNYYYLVADNSINRKSFKGSAINIRGKHYVAIKGVTTGLIDNPRNIWMHPPRQFTFKILQFSPFPFIQFDPKVKNWAWNVEMHAPYLDTRWIPVGFHPKVRYAYVRDNDESISTPFGYLQCSVSTGVGTFLFGDKVITTRLKSYYYPNYGFVKLEFQNINGSKLDINLIETRNN